jgi:undecaprenol kinase
MSRFTSSLRFAVRGLAMVFRTEANFRIQIVIGTAVILLAATVQVRTWEFVAIVFGIGSVLVLECINSAVERLADFVKPKLHGYVQEVKDMMAGAVLLVSIGAALIGATILTPYLIQMFVQWSM